MIQKIKKSVLFIVCIIICNFFFSCIEVEPMVIDGMSPVYISAIDFSFIKSENAKEFENLGNIVNVGDYIFLNELNRGIHVLDNSDPSNPRNIYFWSIPGNREFTIENNILYADNSIHLLVIDIKDFENIIVLNYIKNLYFDAPPSLPKPLDYIGYFECVNKAKGIHVDWEFKSLVDPLCEAY